MEDGGDSEGDNDDDAGIHSTFLTVAKTVTNVDTLKRILFNFIIARETRNLQRLIPMYISIALCDIGGEKLYFQEIETMGRAQESVAFARHRHAHNTFHC